MRISECRICGSDLYKFLSLGEMPLANSFLNKDHVNGDEETFPLDMCLCEVCGLVQLDYLVPQDKMFRNYIYFSSTSDVLQEHFSEMAKEVVERFLSKGAFVVEIASNDGILLRHFQRMNMRVLGIEPAENIARFATGHGIETLNEYWSSKIAEQILRSYDKADVILANNVIGHVHDLHDFTKGISLLLKDDGIAIIQVQYLIDLIENLEYDTVYHEHVSYISLHPVMRLMEKYGLHVFDVKRFPDIHGGSIRFYISKKNEQDRVNDLLKYESRNGFLSRAKYDEFSKSVAVHKSKITKLLYDLKRNRKRIAGYGAAAKANTMLNYCGIGSDVIEYIADKSAHKQGLYTPGTRIPVVPPEKILEDMPDYVVILAWNFADEIIGQLKDYSEKGGVFIIPIPDPRILNAGEIA